MPEIDSALLRYLAVRDAERHNHVSRALDALSERERALVREAAVMGYVLGSMDGRDSTEFPKDAAIVWRVVDACRAHADLYPTLSALAEGGRRG
jgi:hypothetical protein